MLIKFNHINVILVTEIFESYDSYYTVMEYCEGGELFNYIVKKRRLSEEESSFFFYQIINGLEYIHSLNMVHRDLKPENLLLTKDHILKIIDFGLSNYFYDKNDLLSTPCGSPCYASPEMVSGKKYNGFKVDIWSTGIILYAMLCGFLPFEDKNNEILFKKIRRCKLEFPHYISLISKDLIKKILVTNPDKRISIKEIKKHPFFLKGKAIFYQTFSFKKLPKYTLDYDNSNYNNIEYNLKKKNVKKENSNNKNKLKNTNEEKKNYKSRDIKDNNDNLNFSDKISKTEPNKYLNHNHNKNKILSSKKSSSIVSQISHNFNRINKYINNINSKKIPFHKNLTRKKHNIMTIRIPNIAIKNTIINFNMINANIPFEIYNNNISVSKPHSQNNSNLNYSKYIQLNKSERKKPELKFCDFFPLNYAEKTIQTEKFNKTNRKIDLDHFNSTFKNEILLSETNRKHNKIKSLRLNELYKNNAKANKKKIITLHTLNNSNLDKLKYLKISSYQTTSTSFNKKMKNKSNSKKKQNIDRKIKKISYGDFIKLLKCHG